MFDHAVAFWRQRVPSYFWTVADGPYPKHVPRGEQNWNSSGSGSGGWYGQNVFNKSTDGVCQETCRDFGHMQMGMASAHYAAETASVQGIDLWSEQKHRLIAAMEFHSKLLVQDYAPAIPQYVCNGHGAKLGFSPTMEVGYSAYVSRSTVLMPETAKHLKKDIRTMDSRSMCRELIMCFETLTHGVALAEGL